MTVKQFMRPEDKKYQVLIADDCTEDCILLKHALRQTATLETVTTVVDGQQALAYCQQPNRPDEGTPPHAAPDVVIMEMKMPVEDGSPLLQALQTRSVARPLLVVMAGCPLPMDEQEAVRLGADAFFVKPHFHKELIGMAREIEQLTWLAHRPERRQTV
ncbi:MAG: response regulator with CheY-like receiver domain and winged-helix DNA-binding domain [Pedosphaera sp.]|nr:response regulator with CheY-like receiver domain and winged-helix DNA-binding domain [Pedosphaera sp.]